ncbi:MAG TPA: tyrosine-type recombinase/integrase [Cytophagaceae bacterium]|jgi:integrase/recombinase XerD|nr:tyrosine-type recombinase/integrase [Cytophagaceae bacterium]
MKNNNEIKDSFIKSLSLGYSNLNECEAKIEELLYWLESRGIRDLNKIQSTDITQFFDYLQGRNNFRKEEQGLKAGSLNKFLYVIKLFGQFLHESKIAEWHIRVRRFKDEEEDLFESDILSEEEIKSLYEACGMVNHYYFGVRDKVMIHLLYGCGLRRSEAVNVDLTDVNLDTGIIEIKSRIGKTIKNRQERRALILPSLISDFEEYIYNTRPLFSGNKECQSLLLSERGTSLDGQNYKLRLDALIELSGSVFLKEKKITAHSLRHSFASHLMNRGMKLEDIADLLGHLDLDSTNTYLHKIEMKIKNYGKITEAI